MDREGALHTDAEGDLADGEGLRNAAALTGDHNALEDLGTGAAALDDLDVHLEGVTGAEVGHIVAQRSGIDLVDQVGHYSLHARATGHGRLVGGAATRLGPIPIERLRRSRSPAGPTHEHLPSGRGRPRPGAGLVCHSAARGCEGVQERVPDFTRPGLSAFLKPPHSSLPHPSPALGAGATVGTEAACGTCEKTSRPPTRPDQRPMGQ